MNVRVQGCVMLAMSKRKVCRREEVEGTSARVVGSVRLARQDPATVMMSCRRLHRIRRTELLAAGDGSSRL